MTRRRTPPIPKVPQPKRPKASPAVQKVGGIPRGPKNSRVKIGTGQPTPEDMPRWFQGTYPEWLAIDALNKLGFRMVGDPRRELEGTDFVYQDPALGMYVGEAGSTIVDIVLYAVYPPLAMPVQGEFWHPLFGPRYEQDMEIFRRLRDELGWTVIPLDEDDLVENALYVVRSAVFENRDLSRYVGLI